MILASHQVVSPPPLDPFLKWTGGKRRLLPLLQPYFPKVFGRYFEPFFGGGAAFFFLRPLRATLSDNNIDLINCYIQIRDNVNQVVSELCRLPNSSNDYYEIRSRRPSHPVEQAAWMIYLATLSFNGIYRENLNGVFNVPYGHTTHLNPCDEQRLQNASEALASADLRVGDFETAVRGARKGDFVYFDPPYTVAHGNSGFVKYNARIFSWEDQMRLVRVVQDLDKRGCSVIISNADHSSIRKLYSGFEVETIKRFSHISGSAAARREITECIIHNGVR